MIRHPIVWLDLPDPAQTRAKLREDSDQSATHARMMIAAWDDLDPAGAGLTSAEAVRMLDDTRSRTEDPYPTARSVFAEIFGDKPAAKSLGMKLNAMRKRVCAGRTFDGRDARGRLRYWYVTGNGETDESGETNLSNA